VKTKIIICKPSSCCWW